MSLSIYTVYKIFFSTTLHSKQEIRKDFMRKRKEIIKNLTTSLEEKEKYDNQIKKLYKTLLNNIILKNNIRNIAFYIPLKYEFDVLFLTNQEDLPNIKYSIPKVVNTSDKCLLNFYEFDFSKISFPLSMPMTSLVKSSFNVFEPLSSSKKVYPDLIITPLVCYNNQNYRIGYGKGCYDNTFHEMIKEKIRFISISISHSSLFVDNEKYDSGCFNDINDVPVDYIINEKEIISRN